MVRPTRGRGRLETVLAQKKASQAEKLIPDSCRTRRILDIGFDSIGLMFILLVIGLFYFFTIRQGHNPGGDFAQYILHAQNIVNCKNYTDTGYLYNPHYPQLGPKAYPPVYPLMLAPIIKAFGIHFTMMKIQNILFFIFSLIVFYLIIQNQIPLLYSYLSIILLGMNPFFWNFKDDVVSDILFLLLILASLYFIEQIDRKDKKENHLICRALLCGSLLYLCYGTRTAGMALWPTFLIIDWLRSKKVSRFFLYASGFFIIFVSIQHILIHGGQSYFDQLYSLTPRVLLRNVLIYSDSMIKLWDNGRPKWAFLRYILFFQLLILAAIGYIKRLKMISIYELFPIPYLLLIMIWPTPEGARFMIPIIPFFLFYAFVGIQTIPKPVYRNLLLWIMIIFISFSYFEKYKTLNFGPIHDRINKEGMPELCDFVRNHTLQNDIFIFEEPRIFAFCTNRHASSYFQPREDDALWNYINQIHANHLALSTSEPDFIRQFVTKHQNRFKIIYKNEEYILYRILPIP